MSQPEDFFDFSTGVTRGLAKAYVSDIDVFLLFSAGVLLGARSGLLRGIGKATLVYTAYRRGDQYVTALTQTSTQIARAFVKTEPLPFVAPQGVMADD
jgi:hypothetical protein